MPPAAPLVPLLFPGVKGEAISRSARGARAGLSAAIPKVGGGNATQPEPQQCNRWMYKRGEVAVLGGNGACGAEEGESTSRQVRRKHQELCCILDRSSILGRVKIECIFHSLQLILF